MMRARMQELGLSVKEVGTRIGLSDPGGGSVYNWLTGRSAPSPAFRYKLAEALQLDASALVPEGYSTNGGSKRVAGLTNEERLKLKRAKDREYKRRSYHKQQAAPGPAEQAVMLYADAAAAPVVERAPPPPANVFTTAIRSDGSMEIKLNLVLPVVEGIALVQMLYAADAVKRVTSG